jgi:molecular chaperone DnaK
VRECIQQSGISAAELDELVLVGGMTRMPKVIETARKLAGKEPHKGVNPDEVVAVGAAIQGGVLQGDVKDVLLLDVTPLTLAIETAGGVATPMIERNTTIPAKKSQIFSTYGDNQPSVEIVVLQGERPMSRDNKTLGTFRLEGIEPAPRGMPQIEVTFDIDANGILHVSAKDKKTGKENKISITGSSGLSQEEIEKARREAESHAEEDRRRKEEVEIRNNADMNAYQVEKLLKENDDKLPADLKARIEGKVKAVRDALAGASSEAIKAASDDLQNSISELMAAAQQAGAGAGSPPPPPADGPRGDPGGDTVIDAEVVDEPRN